MDTVDDIWDKSNTSYGQLVLFGDSLFQYSSQQPFGLAPALQDLYQRRLDVVTRGFNGYNTACALRIVRPLFESLGKANTHAIVLFFGTNDAVKPGNPQHVPLDRYEENLVALGKILGEYTDNLVVVGVAAVDERGSAPGAKIRTNALNREYNRAACRAAKALNAKFLDLWSAFRRSNGEDPESGPFAGEAAYTGPRSVSHLLNDGIHFAPAAYEIFFDSLRPVLGLDPAKLLAVYPDWNDLAAALESR